MNKIIIVGLGPGDPDYILGTALETLEKTPVIAVSERLLETLRRTSVDIRGKTVIPLGAPYSLKESLTMIREKLKESSVAVGISGDPGFYSLLGYLKRNFKDHPVEVIPGVSSFQYLFSKIGETYQEVKLISLHGRTWDLTEELRTGKALFLLTDEIKSVSYVAELITDMGEDRLLCIGERLSYPDEKILWKRAKECRDYQSDQLTVIYLPERDDEYKYIKRQ